MKAVCSVCYKSLGDREPHLAISTSKKEGLVELCFEDPDKKEDRK